MFMRRMGIPDREVAKLMELDAVQFDRWQKPEEDPNGKFDFYTVKKPFKEFIAEMRECFDEEYVAHHEQSVWQDHDWTHQCRYFPRGSYCSVVDYAENYSHQPKNEHQSKYFSETRSTLYPVVLTVDARDMKDIFFDKEEGDGSGAAEKAKLLEAFEALDRRPVVTVTCMVITADPNHGHTQVMHIDDELLTPFVKHYFIEAPHTHFRRSDGCGAQFKDKHMFYWMSSHKERTGIEIDWSYFCTAHGKCWCDPEGGTFKNKFRAQELKHVPGVKETQMPLTADLTTYASKNLVWPKKNYIKEGCRGIYKRWMWELPTHGPGAVDYAEKWSWPSGYSVDKTRDIHQIRGVGVEGKFVTRDRSCHQCDACWSGDWKECKLQAEIKVVGEVWPVEMRAPTELTRRVARSETRLKELGTMLSEKLKKGDFIAIELAYGDKHSQNEPWVICKVEKKLHTYQGATLPHTEGKMDSAWMGQVQNNDKVLWCTKLEPHSTGGSVFTVTNKAFYVFPTDVRVVLKLEEHVPARQTRHAPVREKYNLKRDQRQTVLEALSLEP